MFWADRIVREIVDTRKPSNGTSFLIRDEKTISKTVTRLLQYAYGINYHPKNVPCAYLQTKQS